jgi:hypothetical protein
MRNFMLILALMLAVTAIAGAGLTEGTLHRSDMITLDATVRLEYSGIDVGCLRQDGDINIGFIVPARWTGSEYQLGQFGYLMGAVGTLTASTSWHSDYVFFIYSNGGFYCTTSAAREFTRNADYWDDEDIANWIYYNLAWTDL